MLAFSSLKSSAYNKRASVITSDDTKALCSEYFTGGGKVWLQVPLVLPHKEARSGTDHPNTCLRS